MSGQVGQALRSEREEQGISLEEVERATKIRARYLAAIEEGDWETLPGRAYARGFLRTYAEHLGLDPGPLVADLNDELDPTPEEAPPEPVVQPGTLGAAAGRRMLARIAAAAATLAAVAVVAVLVLGNDGDAGELGAPAPAPPAEEAPTEPEPEPETDTDLEPPEPEPDLVSVSLEATGAVWVCLVDGRGEAVIDGVILNDGEEQGPFEARRLLMTFGNGDIELEADGEAVEVPAAAEPLGYEVGPEGVAELEEADRPTCG